MKYLELAKLYSELENEPSRLKKTEILAEFLRKLKQEKNLEIIYLLKGRIFPDYDTREIGISTQLAIKALSKSTGISDEEIIKLWKKIGDLGEVAFELVQRKKQSTLLKTNLTTEKVLENLKKLPELEGKGTVDRKISLISELLASASSLEAKYLTRTLLSDLRTGTAEGVLRDAIVWACLDKENKQDFFLVQEAYDTSTDFAEVFERAVKGKKALEESELEPGKPVKVMLYLKVKDIKEGFETVGKPAAIEYKYDGFRMMINKEKSGKIRIFTRRLEEVTKQFPEVSEYVKKYVKGESFILDSEAVGFNPKTKKYKPFQEISQRIKRKYDIKKLEKELPVEINVFDILYYNGKSLIKLPFKERTELVRKIIKPEKFKLVPSEQIITDDENKAEKFYQEALKEGEEGVMIKSLNAPYKPGARVGYGVKLKPSENEFDLVIVKAEYGTGKRAGWLTSYTVACRKDSELLEIGKVSTGLKEKSSQGLSFEEVSKKLKKLVISEHEREVQVKPEIVVTVTYQDIQKSPSYSSGFALRFPRFTALREDRSIRDIATIEEIERDYKKEK
ncbi:ATP-dependent DNA ligase [Candidatus Pacearchaeota archaeon]|nr:ATP-dependent DNA ligase [Candidatus Pacearchaeota archaeon]